MEQWFRVFLRNGGHVDVEAKTYGRDGADWVLYREFLVDDSELLAGEPARRFPSRDVNGIALLTPTMARREHPVLYDRLGFGPIVDWGIATLELNATSRARSHDERRK
jgi:hypothetical protein